MFNFYKFVYGIDFILEEKEVKTTSSLEQLKAQVFSCTKCRLAENRTNVVFGEGNLQARLMFIGEGPGAEEDLQGRPFVGKAGKLLDKMILAMGLKREEVYIANIVKCRPPNNRAPFREEAEMCKPYLIEQINFINPELIICLGSVAVNYLLNQDLSITKVRGNVKEFNGIKVIPTYHPAYLLRNPAKKSETWEDLKKAMSLLNLSLK
jgi:DNA polymerase